MKIFRSPKSIYHSVKWRLLRKYGSPKQLADYLYFNQFGKRINWEHPEDLNQWIAWLQFKTDTTLWVTLADKYRMHDYLKERGFCEYLVPVLAKWETADDIDLTNLPECFVLKCNNGSGDVKIITDKSKADIAGIKEYFRLQMARKFGRDTAEPHYLRIKPLIIAEKLLDIRKQGVKSSSLVDYKFWCFNGQVDRVFVCSDRTKQYFTIDLYDSEWCNIKDGNVNYDKQHLHPTCNMPRPKNLKLMKDIASQISNGFPEIRVDFYEVDGKVYIGELTLTSACGRMDYFTESCLKDMGMKCGTAVKKLKASGKLKTI